MSVSIESTPATSGPPGLVAVKRATTPALVLRLAHEAAVLHAAQHPGVIELLDLTETPDEATLTMGYAGRHTLATIGAFPIERVEAVMSDIAGTVADLHAQGVVHTRIDTTHVVIGPDLRPRLCGFSGGQCASVLPGPMALDVFALGQLLRTLLTPSTDPVPGAHPGETDSTDQLARPCGADTRLRHLLGLAEQAMAPDPRHRPSAAALAASLRTSDSPPGPRPDLRAWRLAAGRPVRILLAGTMALTATAAVGLFLVQDPFNRGRRSNLTQPQSSHLSAIPRGSQAEIVSTSMVTAPASCPEIVGAVATADVDGNGCAETIEVTDRIVQAGDLRFSLGQPGDRVTVGDWDCDGTATAVILRPSTGEVFLFSTWPSTATTPTLTDGLSARPHALVLTGVQPLASDPDSDGCTDLVVERSDGLRVEVPT